MKYSYNVDPLLFGSVESSPYRLLPQSYRNENGWTQNIVQNKNTCKLLQWAPHHT